MQEGTKNNLGMKLGEENEVEYVHVAPSYPQLDFGDGMRISSDHMRLMQKIFFGIAGVMTIPFLAFCFWFAWPVVPSMCIFLFLMTGVAWFADVEARARMIADADAKYLRACQEFEKLRE